MEANAKGRNKAVDADGSFNVWGNSLALRINKNVARVAGAQEGGPVHIHAEPGRIVIEIPQHRKESLAQLLARFEPEQHSGEEMAFKTMGNEAIE